MDYKFFDLAFKYAEKAFYYDEVPIGAVIVKDKKVIACGCNMKEKKGSIFEHAEIIAIKEAEQLLSNWRLNDCDLYVTLDPCPMCASAIKQSRIKNVYSALEKTDDSNSFLIKKIFLCDSTNPEVNFVSNLDMERSKKLLNTFFHKKR